jgi:hypothetical protein
MAGAWRLWREIDDRRAGQKARMEGEARFTPVAGGLLYAEVGWLLLPGQAPLRAERRYLWRAAPGGVAVAFGDGRPFHRFDWAEAPAARHLCGADVYDVVYRFGRWPAWEAEWTVSGPAKDYTMISRYARA